MIDDVAVFEQTAKKSWQSFSTMRRFLDEAVRLENASWRLWFMQLTRVPAGVDQPITEDSSASLHPLCVYCELRRASLSCNGCCHDAYCISCFKVIHKKGNLATHTASTIHMVRTYDFCEIAKGRGMLMCNVVGKQQQQQQHYADRNLHTSSGPSTIGDDANLFTTTPWTSSEGDTEASSPGSSTSNASDFNKPWELQMDMLLQRLMMNSLHSNLGISVHNIDNRESLFPWATNKSERPLTVGVSSEADKDERQRSNQTVVMAAVAAAGRHRAHSLSHEKNRKQSPASSSSTMQSLPRPVEGSDIKLLFSKPFPPTDTRRRDSQTCANCNGNHITVVCPLLERALLPSSTPVGSGVDTVLRKCFTTIHNNNMANSTHAFLGDEVSVHGGSNVANVKEWPCTNMLQQVDRPQLGINMIAEDKPTTEEEDLAPMLSELASPDRGKRSTWHADSWLLSCLVTDLPADVFEQLRRLECSEKNWSFMANPEPSGLAITGYVRMKVPGSQWCRRFLSLYRNNLWEYLDANETSRPVGHANISEGLVHQRSTTEFVLKYNALASEGSGRSELSLEFESEKEGMLWKEMIARAAKLQIDDLFDLHPDSPTRSSSMNFELGKGRFSVVRRARRKDDLENAAVSRDCALKIIEKNVFWELVACETEREDTVVREILTQSLLTVRSGSCYCPVIRLQSLFETRNHLVMELELMRDGDLHEEIATKCAVDEKRASFLVASLVRAIEFCQRNGVAHRDVKLSNLALDYERSSSGKEFAVIKIADFGMAAFIQKNGMLKGRCGTPGFVAPEILCAGKGEAYPCGVDMFSAGVVAYTMLCGYEPFFGVNDDELIQMNKLVDFEFEEPEWNIISDEAKDMIMLMMEKDPYKRMTPKELLEHPFLRDANVALDDLFREQRPFHLTRLL